jgi:hypothetical protein
MTPQEEILLWKSKFRLLRDWTIAYVESDDHCCECTHNVETKTGCIYACKSWGEEGQPPDYFLHEILHIAKAAADDSSLSFSEQHESAEIFIEDLCAIANLCPYAGSNECQEMEDEKVLLIQTVAGLSLFVLIGLIGVLIGMIL